MANLGTPERIYFQAKDFESGLTDITAYVTYANSSVAGPFLLSELSDIKFKGFYYFDFPTLITDPFGNYLGIIKSPSQDLQIPFKVEYQKVTVDQLQSVVDTINESIKLLKPSDLDVMFDIPDEESMDVYFDDGEQIEVEFDCDN